MNGDSASFPPVINALGALVDPNAPGAGSQGLSVAPHITDRCVRDALQSGLRTLHMTLGHVAGPGDAHELTLQEIAAWDAAIAADPRLARVRSIAELDDACAQERLGIVYGFQNTLMLGRDPGRIADYARLGVRVIQLTYNLRNDVGDGAMVPDDQGLSSFGADVVRALQDAGVLLDLSHSSERTCLDALALARRPVAITHTGCRALTDHPRNKSDAELRAVAATGGVVGIYSMPYLRAQGQPMAADLIAHLEHAIAVCGEDHVGLGTDVGTTVHDDPAAARAAHAAEVAQRKALGVGASNESAEVMLGLPDLEGPGQFRGLAERLAARGHGAGRIAKILGGNFRRVFAQAWSAT